jgi:hypothetical protein
MSDSSSKDIPIEDLVEVLVEDSASLHINKTTKIDFKRRAKCRCVSQHQIHPYCLIHKGISICPHIKVRTECSECGGSSLCPHKKIKRQCRECGGSDFCTHDKRKSHCRECGGSALCPHDKQIKKCSECRKCGFSDICEHNKRECYCKICGGSALCKMPRCETKSYTKYDGLCLRCNRKMTRSRNRKYIKKQTFWQANKKMQ